MNMKFVKGMLMGTLLSAGAMYMYSEMPKSNKKMIMKKGKQLAKKIGIM